MTAEALTLPPAAAVADTAVRQPRRGSRRLRLVGRYLLLTVLAAIVLFPIYITIVNSLLRPAQIASQPPALFPAHPLWSSYQSAWVQGHFGHYLFNSIVVTILIVAGQLVTSILAGYAFAFLEFPFKRTLFLVVLASLMVPFEVTVVQNLSTSVDLHLYNTFLGLAAPFLAWGLGVFLLRQAFLSIPRELDDAAKLDGYGHWRFLWRVAVPLARPAIAALTVFSFLTAWNQYLWPLLVTKDAQFRTVQIGLRQLRATSIQNVNITFAGVVIAFLPLVILFLVFQKQLVRGLTAGAVKG
jgi:sn-glycerol 3-phosphate transport system permease protein